MIGWIDDKETNSSETEQKHRKWLEERLAELNSRRLTGFAERPSDANTPTIIVVNDRDHGFRKLEIETALNPFIPSPSGMGGEGDKKASPYVIVLEMELRSLSAMEENKLWREIVTNHAERTVVVVSVESLREAGVNISDAGSIEQLVEGFLRHLDGANSALARLAKCRHLVVWFRDGAIHYDNTKQRRITDYFCPYGADDPGSTNLGSMAGYTTILVASIVRGLACWMSGDREKITEPPQVVDDLAGVESGIGLGVVLCRQHFTKGIARIGFLTTEHPNYEPNPHPFERIFIDYDEPARSSEKDEPELFLSRVEFEIPNDSKHREWGRITRLLALRRAAPYNQDAKEVALDIVKRGLKHVVEVSEKDVKGMNLPSKPAFPMRRILCPYGRFGEIETVDRDEIDNYISLCAVISKYLCDTHWQIPLAIAVFGPPGSGKSFSIRQILEKVAPGHGKNSLEFNVAQFANVKDLATAFHQAQDRALASEVPLVTFDEFDANLGREALGWVKYFLAPMQDGKFKDGESMYRIGRAIFVFSGGTAHSFHDFTARCRYDAVAREAKGPDFISRLRGHLNVKGINSTGAVGDILMIRRAILLRSILKRKCAYLFDPVTEEANVQNDVISAFLKVTKYKHGVRSMEAIIEMSQVSHSRGYLKSSIPHRNQLEMHVDADEFADHLTDSSGSPGSRPDADFITTVFDTDPLARNGRTTRTRQNKSAGAVGE